MFITPSRCAYVYFTSCHKNIAMEKRANTGVLCVIINYLSRRKCRKYGPARKEFCFKKDEMFSEKTKKRNPEVLAEARDDGE